MVAFSVFWVSVYRYWIFYLITFLYWYRFLWLLWSVWCFKKFPWVQHILTNGKDDFILGAVLWVLLWWRLWHVFFYEWSYYATNLLDILRFDQWWMSFVWWVLGVSLFLLYLMIRKKITWTELKVLWDIVLCIVPVWILLWRIWNFLNQELRWKPIHEIAPSQAHILQTLWLTTTYESVDDQLRVNTNIIQAILEWALLLITNNVIAWKMIKKSLRTPWTITWVFLIVYWIVRFFIEWFKDLPAHEIYGIFSISQYMMIRFLIAWCVILLTSYSDK